MFDDPYAISDELRAALEEAIRAGMKEVGLRALAVRCTPGEFSPVLRVDAYHDYYDAPIPVEQLADVQHATQLAVLMLEDPRVALVTHHFDDKQVVDYSSLARRHGASGQKKPRSHRRRQDPAERQSQTA